MLLYQNNISQQQIVLTGDSAVHGTSNFLAKYKRFKAAIHANQVRFLFLVLIIAFGIVIRANVAGKHRVPQGDEGPWLRLAVRVPAINFMTSQIIEHDLYRIRTLPHPEDNRSPLFPVLIAVFHLFFRNVLSAAQVLNILAYLVLTILLMKNLFARY